MLRINVLAVMCLGLLMACGPNEAEERQERSEESVGQARAALSVSPSSLSLSFSQQMRGTQSTSQSVTLSEPWGGSNRTCNFTIGTNDPFVLLDPADSSKHIKSLTGYSVNKGTSRTLSVVFVPTVVEDAATGTLDISCTGGGGFSDQVSLSGTATTSAAVDSTSLAFEPQKTGTTSQPKPVVVSNSSTAFNIIGITATGAFEVSDPTSFPATVAGGTSAVPGSKTISVVFKPTAAGALTGTLTIETNEPSTLTVSLSGTKVELATQVSPTTLPSFGEQRVDTTSTAQTVTVRNAGDTDLNITTFPITGPFALVAPPTNPLAPGASQTLSVTFTPTGDADATGSLDLTTDETDPAVPAQNVTVPVGLSGKGVKPNLVLTPTSPLAFADQRVNTDFTKTVTVSNTGSGPITFSDITKTGAAFTFTSPQTPPFTLAAGADVVLSVTFRPTVEGDAAGTLTLATADLDYSPGVVVDLTGKGVKPNVAVDFNPLAFGSVRLGSTPTRTVTVSNNGTGPITITGITKDGHSAFTLVTPPSTPFTLATGESQVFSVKYSPTAMTAAAATDTGTLALATADLDYAPSVVISLTGKGVKPILELDPNPLAFDEQRVTTETTKVVTLRNTGNGPITLTSITKGGSSAFTVVSSPGMPLTLAGGTEQGVSVKFSPITETSEVGSLTLATDDPDYSPSVVVNLTGKGVNPLLVLNPSPLVFGELRVNTEITLPITVKNNGTGTIYISEITKGGHAAFSLVSPRATPFPLAAGAEQVVSVKYKPTLESVAGSTDTGTLTVSGGPLLGGTWSTATANLTGTGVKPNVAVDFNPLAFGNVRVGGTPSKTVTVSNNGTGPITISSITKDGHSAFTLVTPPSTPFTLAAGESQVFSVKYSPTVMTAATATDTGTLTLATADLDYAPGIVINLTGKGVKPILELVPNPLEFGAQRVDTAQTKTVMVSNTGTGPITLSSITKDGHAAFTLVTVLDMPLTLAAGQSQPVSVKYTPTAVTAATATDTGTLTLATDDPDYSPSVVVDLTGKGVKPNLVLDPNPLAFGELRVNASLTKKVKVSNLTGTGPLVITSIFKSGHTAFSLGSLPSMPHTLAAGTELEVSVTYNPTTMTAATGTDTGTLNLLTEDPEWASVAVDLTGKGVKPILALDPSPLAFGDVRVDTTPTKTVTVRNNGTGPITITGISKGGHTAFTLVTPPSTPFTLAAGESQVFSVKYSPIAVSTTTDTGTLTLATDDPDYAPSVVINLTGKGVMPNLVLDPNPLAFGNVRVDTESAKTVTVRNTGSGPITISEIAKSANPVFTLGTLPSMPLTLAAGSNVVLSVKFKPTGLTEESATLTLSTEDPAFTSVTVNLTGKGVIPDLVLDPPTELAFGDVRVNTNLTKTVTVRNNGSGPITISGLSTGTGTPFTLVNPPGTPFSVAAGSNVVLSVKFSPIADASATGTLTLNTEDPGLPVITVNLTGNGVKPNLVLDPNPLAFGDVHVNSELTKTVTVRNTGTGPITISGLSTGTGTPFTLVNPPGTPFTLDPGSNRALSVKFSPIADASATGTLTLTTLDPELASAPVSLTGRGVMPNLVFDPDPLAFGDVRVDTTSTKTVTVSNNGTGSITITGITKGGHAAFTLVTPPSTPFTLAAGQSQPVSVKYSPTVVTAATATDTGSITLNTEDPGLPSVTVNLTGKGVMPDLVLDPPTELAFGDVRVNTNLTKTVTVRNNGSGSITISGLSTGTGTPFALFNPPGTPFTLAAGTERVLSVKFSPTADASATGTLTLNTEDPGLPVITVSLTGNGVKPNLVLDPSPLDFGPQIVGDVSTTRMLKVRNTGTGPVRITGMSIAPTGPFSIVSSTAAFNLAASESADIQVLFTPTSKTDYVATLTLSTDEATPSAAPVSLSGTGVSSLNVDPADLIDFGEVPKGQTVTRTVTLTNQSAVSIGSLSVSSVTAPFVATQPQLTTLTTRGATTTFTVSFTPNDEMPFSTTFTLSSDASNSPHTFTLKGSGVVPVAKLSLPFADAAPIASLNFEGVRVNATTQLTVRLTNTGKAPLSLLQKPYLSSSVDGGTSVFSYLGPDTMTLAPGTYIDFQVAFQPAAKITYSDTLTIRSNAVNSPTSLSLTGFGADPELTLDRDFIYFGDVRVGSRSTGIPVTINNTGNAPVSLQNLPVAGPFEVVLPKESDGGTVPLPRTIAVRGSFTFDAVYKPTAEAAENGTVSILTDMSVTDGGTLMVALSGNGTTSRLGTSVSSLDFGGQRVRQTSGVLPVVLTNYGKAELEISQFVFSNSMFNVSAPLPLPAESVPLKLGSGQQKTISVTFTPSTLGAVNGQFFIISNAANANDAGTLSLSGRGIDGQLSMTPSVVSFDGDGGVEVAGSGAQQSVALKNIGEATLTISGLEPPDGGAFTVSGLPIGQSDAGVILQPNGEWPLTVTFTPERRGFVSTSAIIRSDSVISPAFNMLMKGTGVAAAVDLLPKDIFFGKSNVGVPTTQDISIKNVGERDLYVSNITFVDVTDAGVSGAALDFRIGGGDDGGTTVAFPMVVTPGNSTLVPLKFTPREVGMRRARAVVYTNDKVVEANLQGEGSSPNLELSPPELDFRSVVTNKPSAPRVLTIKNTGTGPLTLRTMTLGGADATSFILTPPELPITLEPAASTTVSVSLTPTAERQFTAQLVIQSNDPDVPSLTVPMFGTGVRQQILLSKSSLEFGQHLINNTSLPRELLITNSSDTNITLTALAVEGTGASQFTLPSLGLPLVMTPGKEQKVALTFTPLAEADVNCVLKISFSDLQQPLEVALHGKGIPAVLSIAPSPLDFGGVRVGGGRRENPLTITNMSSDPITLDAPEVTYDTGEPFFYDGASLEGRELAPGMSAIVPVGYEPMEETLSETILSFGTIKPQKPRSVDVQLKGSATRRLLFVDQESLDFGFVKVGKPGEPKMITITNKSAQQQRVVVKLRDVEGVPFILETKELANAIAPRGTAIFSVSFEPDSAGAVENEVQVWLQGATEAEALIPVKGQGTALVGSGGGCSCNTTEAGSAGMLMLLALVGLGSRRRRRG